MPRKKKELFMTFDVNGRNFPLRVYVERRNNVRSSLGKKNAILRMPVGLSEKQQQKFIQNTQNWIKNLVAEKPEILERICGRNYGPQNTLTIGDRTYNISIKYEDEPRHHAKRHYQDIFLTISSQEDAVHQKQTIKKMLSKMIASDFLPDIARRVHELNHLHFQKSINSVKLKYNSSNWGSCSSKTNINLSTRLLFAPPDVIDYVIIHELAHLTEMNHSPRFWAIVENAMPDYRKKERWLKEHGHKCDF